MRTLFFSLGFILASSAFASSADHTGEAAAGKHRYSAPPSDPTVGRYSAPSSDPAFGKIARLAREANLDVGLEKGLSNEDANAVLDRYIQLIPTLQALPNPNKIRRAVTLGKVTTPRYYGYEVNASNVSDEELLKSVKDQRWDKRLLNAWQDFIYQRLGIGTVCTGYISRDRCGDQLVAIFKSPGASLLKSAGVTGLYIASRFQPADEHGSGWFDATRNAADQVSALTFGVNQLTGLAPQVVQPPQLTQPSQVAQAPQTVQPRVRGYYYRCPNCGKTHYGTYSLRG